MKTLENTAFKYEHAESTNLHWDKKKRKLKQLKSENKHNERDEKRNEHNEKRNEQNEAH